MCVAWVHFIIYCIDLLKHHLRKRQKQLLNRNFRNRPKSRSSVGDADGDECVVALVAVAVFTSTCKLLHSIFENCNVSGLFVIIICKQQKHV